MNLSRRRQARELTLQILFQSEFSPELNPSTSLNYFKNQFEAHNEVYSYAESLVLGILKHKENIDSLIKSKALNWKFSRIASVDKNILRISIFELIFSDSNIPPITSIDEALHIAKKYSSTDSHQFINGILDNIIKEKNLT